MTFLLLPQVEAFSLARIEKPLLQVIILYHYSE